MNKSKIKNLMWWSVGSLAILIFVTISITQKFLIALIGVILYCSLPTLFTILAINELNKGDVKSIEEFDAQEELNQHIKNVKKEKRQKWWKENKKIVIIACILICCIILFIGIYYLVDEIIWNIRFGN